MKAARMIILVLTLLCLLIAVVPVGALTDTAYVIHDGYATADGDQTWATAHAATGNVVVNLNTNMVSVSMLASTTTNQSNDLRRGIITFSPIPAGRIVDTAILSGRVYDLDNKLGAYDLSLINATPAADNLLVASDYSKTGFVRLAPDLTYGSQTLYAWTANWTLNDQGISRISNTSNWSMMIAMQPDVNNFAVAPGWTSGEASYIELYSMKQSAGANKMFITYTYHLNNGTINTYPVPFNNTMYQPFNQSMTSPAGSSITVNVTRNQTDTSSFVIKPDNYASDMAITVDDLTNATGGTIPKSAVDIRLNKFSWKSNYAHTDTYTDPVLAVGDYAWTYGYLWKNDSVYNSTWGGQQNTIHVRNNTFEGEIHLDNTSINQWMMDYQVFDQNTTDGFPMPFKIAAGELKQAVVLLHTPASTPAGNYTGNITIASATTGQTVNISYTARVLPFDFASTTPSLYYDIYYRASLGNATVYNQSWVDKTTAQYALEMQDIKNHGFVSTLMWINNGATDDTQFQIYYSTFPDAKSRFNLYNTSIATNDASNAAQNTVGTKTTALLARVHNWSASADMYILAQDEPDNTAMTQVKPSYITMKNNGSKFMLDTDPASATKNGGAGILGNLIDNPIIAIYQPTVGYYNQSALAVWKATGASKVLIYDYYQAGIEKPESYRKNYGYALWNSSFSGTWLFSYGFQYGQNALNQFDSVPAGYRTEAFVFPINNGVIPKVEWEGMGQATVDAQYADKLMSLTNRTFVNQTIQAGIASGDMSSIRQNMTNLILAAYGNGNPPEASFTKDSNGGAIPITVSFTDTSTNGPTSWRWFNNLVVNSTSQNPALTFSNAGNFSIQLEACNPNGCSNSSAQWVNTTLPAPTASFTQSRSTVQVPQTVTFTDTSTGTPTSWLWLFGDGNSSTLQNPTYGYPIVGSYEVDLKATNAVGSSWHNVTGAVTVDTGTAGGNGALSSTSGHSSIILALQLIGLGFIVIGAILIASLFTRFAGMGRGGSAGYESPLPRIVLGLTAIVLGAVMLFISYAILNPIFALV